MKKTLYITLSFAAGALLVFAIMTAFNTYKENQAIHYTEQYLAEQYPELQYEILGIYSSTNFKHYGYFEHSLAVRDADALEIFEVYYDPDMNRMEDSRKIRAQETFLATDIQPNVEQYIAQHFGGVRYIDVHYYMETGKPMILVKFNEGTLTMSQAQFDAFLVFIQEELALTQAHVIVDEWLGNVAFQEEL